MDEVRTKQTEIEVNQEKIDYINYAYSEEVTNWKKAAWERISAESEEKELVDLAPFFEAITGYLKTFSKSTILRKMKIWAWKARVYLVDGF